MKKIIFILFLLLSSLYSSMLLDKSYPICIEDYYVKSGTLYYLKSSNGNWGSTTSDKLVQQIHYGYTWDNDNNICKPQIYNILGIDPLQWNFLLALTGLLFGFVVLFFLSYLVTQIGGKK